MCYIFVNKENDKILGCGQAERIDVSTFSVEVEEELYNEYKLEPYKYMAVKTEVPQIVKEQTDTDTDADDDAEPVIEYIYEIVPNPNYEQEHAAQERQRLNMLSLTKREVFLALYRAKSITPEMVRSSITDAEALIEFDYAERFYRGNPLIDAIGINLGYSIEDLDHLFEYKELPTNES